jgi:hypothetical protein
MAIVFITAIGLASPISSAAIAKLNADDADPTIHRVFLTMVPKKVWIYYLVSFR